MNFQGPRQLATALQAAVRGLASCVRPLSLIEEGSGGKRFIGSAFIVAAGQRRIVITAEHVVSGPEVKFLGLSEAGGINWPKDYFRVEAVDTSRTSPDIAFAIADVAAEDPTSEVRPLPIDLLYPGQSFEVGASMVAVGFPGSKAKSREGQSRLSAKLMSVVGDLAPDDVYSRLGKSAVRTWR